MDKHQDIQMIPIDKVHVLNPRNRDKRKFGEIVTNISHLGLKRPIVVSRRSEVEGDDGYDLVCGQGRLEAFQKLGQTMIPAIVTDISRDERLLGSLVENCARRTPRMIEMVRQIGALRDKGYKNVEIARKIDIDETMVSGVITLLDQGEERLLQAVECDRKAIEYRESPPCLRNGRRNPADGVDTPLQAGESRDPKKSQVCNHPGIHPGGGAD